MAIIFELYVFDALITAGLSNAMPDFMQNKKSAKRSINTNKSTTRPVTTKKSATGPFKKSAKQASAARPRSPDESSAWMSTRSATRQTLTGRTPWTRGSAAEGRKERDP